MSANHNMGRPVSCLKRCKPEVIPAIHPLPEYLAEGARKAIYDDTKAVLQVPWMGVVTMAFAHYPHFYVTLWQGLRPLYTSKPMVEACARLRQQVEAAVEALLPPHIGDRVTRLGYAPREVAQIREMLEVFSYGNFPYLLLATQARLLLEGYEFSTERQTEPSAGQVGPQSTVPFVLMEAHHADQSTRNVYQDIQAVLGLPFVNTDYRALARWPSYFATAWGDLRTTIPTNAYQTIVADIHHATVETALALPNPGGLTVDRLRAAVGDSNEEIAEVVRLFQWLLPGLVTNIAFYRAQWA